MTAHPTFTPGAMGPEDLDAITVGREALFDTLVHRIRGAASGGARPHTLLIAPRGGGKTHTLHVAVNRSLADTKTAEHILPVLIPEDSLAIGSYLDLLVEIARTIDFELGEAARGMRRDKDTVGIEQAITTAAAGRMILLAIENLDRVFDELGETGQGSLRAWVETSTEITVFATAPALFSGVSSRSYPWYGSFMVETLPELSIDEGATMLGGAARRRGDKELAEFIDSPTGLERLQVIHRLAGGSPRLWHMLSDCIDVRSLDALVPTVEALLDRLAPYYQQRLWQLPPGEQRLVVELARGWEPQTVGDLAAAVGVSNQSAATALGRLAASRWVTSTKARDGDQRASWYDVTEPLLRYHLQYREERGKPLRLIVEFLRGFYSAARLMAELGQAKPDSPLERHLQRALLRRDELWSPRAVSVDADDVLTGLRLWIGDDANDIPRLGVALESVMCAAYQRPQRRAAPNGLEQLITRAVTASSESDGHGLQRLHHGLTVLADHAWTEAEEDALLAFRIFLDTEDPDRFDQLAKSDAVRKRRTSGPALFLRHMSAMLADGDNALRQLNDILDDLEGAQASDAHKIFSWRMWIETVERVPSPPARDADALVAVALTLNLQESITSPDQLPRVLAALTPNARAATAGVLAHAAASGELSFPPEFSPLDALDKHTASVVLDMIRSPSAADENAATS
ncbi:MAG: hypothetical protein QOF88_5986 [Mycobacterium sp.]|nr:hypothetical protein [Mycobacterium sp.]